MQKNMRPWTRPKKNGRKPRLSIPSWIYANSWNNWKIFSTVCSIMQHTVSCESGYGAQLVNALQSLRNLRCRWQHNHQTNGTKQIKQCTLLKVKTSRDSAQDNARNCAKVGTGAQYPSRFHQRNRRLVRCYENDNMEDIRRICHSGADQKLNFFY